MRNPISIAFSHNQFVGAQCWHDHLIRSSAPTYTACSNTLYFTESCDNQLNTVTGKFIREWCHRNTLSNCRVWINIHYKTQRRWSTTYWYVFLYVRYTCGCIDDELSLICIHSWCFFCFFYIRDVSIVCLYVHHMQLSCGIKSILTYLLIYLLT